jgi:hypothetical protein
MSTSATSPDIDVEQTAPRPTRSLHRTTAAVAVSAAATTTGLAAVLRAAGVPLAVHGTIPLAAIAQFTFIGAVIGGVLLAVLIRRSTSSRQWFVRIAIGLTALSCAAPLAFADTVASKLALVGLHLIAAAIIVWMLVRFADRPSPTNR